MTFINVEPYQLEDVDGQLQPVLDANGELQATTTTNEWGLLTEPWIFVVDRDGIVRGSYEVAIRRELPSSTRSLAGILSRRVSPAGRVLEPDRER